MHGLGGGLILRRRRSGCRRGLRRDDRGEGVMAMP